MRAKVLLITLLVLALFLVAATPVAAAPAAASGPTWHKVASGETLFSIGRLYNVSPWAIASANRLANPNRIYAGQRLYIPAGPPYYQPRWCGSYYTVRRGDTLLRIGRAYGVSASGIARANRIYNMNYIWAGQVLCIPGPVAEPHSSFDLVVEHAFDVEADPDADNWTLGRNRKAGARLSYPLLSGDDIKTYPDVSPESSKVKEASSTGSPLLWLVRTSPDASTYIMAVIGDPAPLLDLQMEVTPTQNITDIIPAPNETLIGLGLCPETRQPVNQLSVSGQATISLWAELVTTEGTFIPINIVEIDYHETVQRAGSCYEDVGFALHANASRGYRLLMVMDDGTIGPPGDRWRVHYERWKGGGWWSRWRRAWYGSPWR